MTSWNLPRLAQGAAVAACLTSAQHALLVDAPLSLEQRYALGVTALVAGLAIYDRHAALALLVIAAVAGAPVAAGYTLRRRQLDRSAPPWLAAR